MPAVGDWFLAPALAPGDWLRPPSPSGSTSQIGRVVSANGDYIEVVTHAVVNGADNGPLTGPRLVNVDDTVHWRFVPTFAEALALA